MTREIIEDYRFIVIPYVVNRLNEINYEGKGDSDAKEFMRDFNEIFDLAIKALEQEPKSEWQKDHEILKAYSDGANEVLDKIRAEIEQDAFSDVNGEKFIFVNRINQIIDKYKGESEDKR